MNNKGFTLIELIATIALLAVISIISFVSINSVVEKNKISNCETLVSNIEIAAKEYISDNRYNIERKNLRINISILINGNYLSGDVIDPFTDKRIGTGYIYVYVYLNDDYTVNSVDVKNASNVTINCDSGRL